MSADRTAKTALITGAVGGVGSALCATFTDAGYRVIGCDVRDGRPSCDIFLQCQLLDLCGSDAQRQELLARIRQAIGDGGLSVLVNNAAVQILAPADSITVDQWRETLDTNLLAPFLLTQGLLPELERGRGSVVNVASIHANLTKPGFVAYATSKAALVGLTRSLAVDLGGRVRVNAVLPAATATPMLVAGFEGRPGALEQLAAAHPIKRIAHPEEVAAAVAYLASDAASFLTGATLPVDGGIGGRLHDPA